MDAESKEPVREVTVRYVIENKGDPRSGGLSSAYGEFSVNDEDLKPGIKVKLSFYHPEYLDATNTITLSENNMDNDITVELKKRNLPKERVIAGRVRDKRNNEPVASAKVTLTSSLGNSQQRTGLNGQFEFKEDFVDGQSISLKITHFDYHDLEIPSFKIQDPFYSLGDQYMRRRKKSDQSIDDIFLFFGGGFVLLGGLAKLPGDSNLSQIGDGLFIAGGASLFTGGVIALVNWLIIKNDQKLVKTEWKLLLNENGMGITYTF